MVGRRTDIEKDDFLDYIKDWDKAELDVVHHLIAWTAKSDLKGLFSAGIRCPYFSPWIPRGKQRCRLASVQSDGWVVIPIRWMATRLPFSSLEKQREIIRRIEGIPGRIIKEKGHEGFPKFRLKRLSEDPAQLRKFDETLDWILAELRKADS